MADPVASIAGSAAKSVRPFRSSEAYVEAMKEDLAEWLNALYGLGLPGGGDGFLMGLATGTTLCQHANAVTEAARALAAARPARGVAFQAHSVAPGSFVARDNVATFIGWGRAELGVPEVLMFETEDLVLRKNEKSVVLCLLEVARRGARLGLLAPRLVQFEQEIEQELRAAPSAPHASAAEDEEGTPETAAAPGAPTRGPRMTPMDLRNLDELVREILGHCTCPDQFPMIKVSEGKYRVGDSSLLIFVRVSEGLPAAAAPGLGAQAPGQAVTGLGGSCRHRPPPPRTQTFPPQRVSPTPSPRAGSPAPGGERRGSRAEVTPVSLRSAKEGPETPLRARDQLPPHPRSRRYSGDSDSSASSAQSGPLGGSSGRSSPHTPRARSPAAPRPPRVSSPSPELGATPASVFRTPLQLEPQHEEQLFRRLEEEFLANARALEAIAGGAPSGPAPDPARAPDAPGPDSAYCSSSSSSSSLCVPDASGSHLAGPEPPRTWARGRMDTQPDGKPSRIPTPRGPRRPSEPTVPGAWRALRSVSPRVEPDSWM
ncbi:GAS2-like protein 1 [Myotis davidii]|uniref:GAS2-like protein 1 n=1 Tax=Myotis davidii TaxID=225400 RepID=L5LZR9_MYODS|nr:GAS2-like protein 1 [Myotis davidii]